MTSVVVNLGVVVLVTAGAIAWAMWEQRREDRRRDETPELRRFQERLDREVAKRHAEMREP